MALNLSTLTNPATSGGILAEALTTADFLDPVPILKNLSRGSNKGGDAKQTTALNQPRALPLIKNPSGNLGGYLYIPNVSGNYATGPSVTIGANQTWEGELDMVITQWGNYIMPMGGGDWALGFGILFYNNGFVNTLSKAGPVGYGATGITLGTPFNVKYGFNGTDIYADIDGVRKFTETASSQAASITHTLELNQQTLTNVGNYAIQKAKLTVNSAVVFDCDFNGSTSIRHGDTKFNCVGGPVVLNQSGNDPATVIKKSVLRFDGTNDGLQGLFNQTITDGYMFAAFSVLGDGGDAYGRLFGASSTGVSDSQAGGFTFRRFDSSSSIQLGHNAGFNVTHSDVFNGVRGDLLLECKLTATSQPSKINNSDADNGLSNLQNIVPNTLSSEEFRIATSNLAGYNAAIDLEYLALFPATITDDQADSVRNYINNRNNVFSLIDSQGYYFFDPQKASFTGNFTAANTLDGYITGSDNGDTDVRTNLTLEQSTLNDQPSTDGYTITFNDSAEHLQFVNGASQNLSGWQIAGTSLGTFAYRVDNDAVIELNLLGSGDVTVRSIGDLYGMILLPETATGADIESARRLLIDRGASDGVSASNVANFWRSRDDIVQFNNVNFSGTAQADSTWRYANNMVSFNVSSMPDLTFAQATWSYCTALTSFSTSLPAVTHAQEAWTNCTSLSDFRTIDLENCANFTSAWQNTTALTSFPSGAKLGTSASNVNFTSAWQSSGLTSFSTPLPSATNVSQGWYQCASLTSFSSDLSAATTANYAWLSCTSLTSFDTPLPSATQMLLAWYNCSSLTSFSSELPLAANANQAWLNCTSLTDFSVDVFANWNPSSITSGVFNLAWDGCVALTAQSVGNILQSIDASNQHGTDDGTSTGNPLGDSGIDIDYNVATGSLSAATNAAIDSLSGKGWEVYINGVLVIPNILDLAPAAAYSLRSFDANADPNVVNVRRSSDSALRDFKASEVSDGTLTTWVNTEYNRYTSDFSSGVDGWSSDGGNSYDFNQSVAGVTQALKITNVSNNYGYKIVGAVNGLSYRFSAKVYIPSSNTSLNALKFRFGYVPNTEWMTDSINTLDQWVTVTVNSYQNPMTSAAERLYWYHDSSATSGDVFYLKDVEVTQLTADGHVTTWYDQSSNGRDSSQATASEQPKIVDAGTLVTEGGLTAVDFGLESDSLSLDVSGSCDVASIFTVTKPNTSSGNSLLGVSGAEYIAVEADTLAYRVTSFDGLPFANDFTQQLAVLIREDGAGTQPVHGYRNGVVSTEDPCDTNQELLTGNVSIGRRATSDYYDGTIQEIVIYDSDQSANRTGIENNINDHFDIYS